jgi:hypothetical protein
MTVLLVFLYLIDANNSVLLLYACAHKISLKYLFPEKNCHRNVLLKMTGQFDLEVKIQGQGSPTMVHDTSFEGGLPTCQI